MHLLQLNEDDSFSHVDYIDPIPPYAILSHTWGEDKDEVTYKDILDGLGAYQSKPGYQKLKFCAKQAANDKLAYFWVDTCCIDKTSSSELMEAINSMFHWYQDASRCYVYMADVSKCNTEGSPDNLSHLGSEWYSEFQSSRWFTRGWTLQELLAPRSVEFFSAGGNKLGTKESLQRIIHERTTIPLGALQGEPLSSFSIEQRFSWAAQRSTKREEDAVYSLLGIFDVHMPLIYGERRVKAWRRLLSKIVKYEDRQTQLLHDAIKFDQVFVVRQLVKDQASIDVKDKSGYTPLYWAVEFEREAITNLFLEMGADLNLPVMGTMTTFWLAVYRLRVNMITVMVRHKTLRDSQPINSRCALLWASLNGDVERVRRLIDDGVDLNTREDWVDSPLVLAVIGGHSEVTRLLLEEGAEGDIPNRNGRTPLWLAARFGHTSVVKVLLEAGVNAFSRDEWSESPLFWAREGGHKDIVEILSKQ